MRCHRAEPASVVAFWYHAVSLAIAIVALASGEPEFPVMPSLFALAMVLVVGIGSYVGQICWARAFQIGNAARMSAITYTEVSQAGILCMFYALYIGRQSASGFCFWWA